MTSRFLGGVARGRLVLGVVGLLVGALSPFTGANAYTHKILYSFCAKTNCADGAMPVGGIIMDSAGALYGTAFGAGAHNMGTVFKLTPNAQKTKWKLQTLYDFCAKAGCTDGEMPNGSLVLDSQGNLYGQTISGGDLKEGSIFMLSPVAGHARWRLKRLYSNSEFEFLPATGLTYEGDQSGALYDGVSPLYGTGAGGAFNGVVFSIVPGKKLKIVHSFSGDEGNYPNGPMMFDASGNLYGTAETGGAALGTVFELSPNARRTKWTLKVLYNFCPTFDDCTDGSYPGVVMNASGALFGATIAGGASNDGVVYRLDSDGSNWQETVLHSFCSLANCADGSTPGSMGSGPLSIDASGNLFGSTYYGGGNNIDANGKGGGVVYELNGAQTVLYAFCAESSCKDGEYPSSGLLVDGSGNLIGTTSAGGAYGGGTIYELTP